MRRGILSAAGSAPGWLPSELPNLLGWYDAADSATIILTDGKVSAWNSKVGANHLIQTTDANRPVVSGATLNSKALLNYDGGDRWLNLTTRLTNIRTAAILCKWADTTGDYRFIFGDTSQVDWHGDLASENKLFRGPPFEPTAITLGNKWVNGVDTAGLLQRYTAWTRHVFSPTVNQTIGNVSSDRGIAGRSFKGDIAEVIFMSSVITADDRLALESYWKSKYNL